MFSSKVKTSVLSVFAAGALLACSDSATSAPSATDEGNRAATTISGVAATGWAIANREINIVDVNGEQVFSGQTDEAGKYQAKIQLQQQNYPLTIEVESEEGELSAVILSDEVEGDAEVTAHVNPITDFAHEELMLKFSSLKDIVGDSARNTIQTRLNALLGEGVSYQAFAANPRYIAAKKGDTTVIPSSEDMILHALGEEAKKAGNDVGAFLQNKAQEKAQLMAKEEFGAQLAVQMSQFKLDPEKVRTEMQSIRSESAAAISAGLELSTGLRTGLKVPGECSTPELENLSDSVVKLELMYASKSEDTEIANMLQIKKEALDSLFKKTQAQCSVSFEVPQIDALKQEMSSSLKEYSEESGSEQSNSDSDTDSQVNKEDGASIEAPKDTEENTTDPSGTQQSPDTTPEGEKVNS